jgi:hypothetical protein
MTVTGTALDPQLAWALSGAMALSGHARGMPRLAPGPLASFAYDEVAALAAASGSGELRALDGAALLGERAAVAGLRRRGRTAPGGSCRLVRSRDGWLALNLARADDLALLPAWLCCEPDAFRRDPWPALKARCREVHNNQLLERGDLLGLAVADALPPTRVAPPGHRSAAAGPQREPRTAPLVLDLSSLWAGPLCAHLLQLAGAQVVKVESRARPDGARRGPRTFFDLLNAGKRSVALDLDVEDGRAALRQLIARADVVVESARPRALQQLGISAERWVAETPGLVWVSITGYGRACDRVAFGDDAACAAGLASATGEAEGPLFCGDAIADPLTGIHAARIAWEAHRAGGGVLLDVALRDVAAFAATGAAGEARVVRRAGALAVESAGGCAPVAPPWRRPLRAAARSLGADTRAVLC